MGKAKASQTRVGLGQVHGARFEIDIPATYGITGLTTIWVVRSNHVHVVGLVYDWHETRIEHVGRDGAPGPSPVAIGPQPVKRHDKRIAGFGPLYVERPRHGVSALTYLLSTGVATAGIYRGRTNGVARGDMEHGLVPSNRRVVAFGRKGVMCHCISL